MLYALFGFEGNPRDSDIISAFESFPNTTFIWKYEDDSDENALSNHPNIYTMKWVPQIDLLGKLVHGFGIYGAVLLTVQKDFRRQAFVLICHSRWYELCARSDSIR